MNGRIFVSMLAAALWPGLALADHDDADRSPEIPSALDIGDDELLQVVTHAEGVQIYDCKASGGGYAWVFRAPDATLYSNGGSELGIHYAGPTWEWNSGGTVRGTVKARYTPDASAIPWLRLSAVADGPGPLSKITTILRMDTVGGIAPSSGCDASTAGAVANVPYTAAYYFFRNAGS